MPPKRCDFTMSVPVADSKADVDAVKEQQTYAKGEVGISPIIAVHSAMHTAAFCKSIYPSQGFEIDGIEGFSRKKQGAAFWPNSAAFYASELVIPIEIKAFVKGRTSPNAPCFDAEREDVSCGNLLVSIEFCAKFDIICN